MPGSGIDGVPSRTYDWNKSHSRFINVNGEIELWTTSADNGFQVGDVILDVGGKSVANPGDVRKQLADARKEGKRALLFRVKSGEGTRFVALPLNNA